MSFLGVALVQGTEQELDEWNPILLHFRPDSVFVLGGISWKPYRQKTYYPEVLVAPPETKVVVLAPRNGSGVQGTESLDSFKHPEKAIYVFGEDHNHFNLGYLERPPDNLVYIQTDGDLQMHSYVAGAIALYHRRLSSGK